jgi:hypothetical protein
MVCCIVLYPPYFVLLYATMLARELHYIILFGLEIMGLVTVLVALAALHKKLIISTLKHRRRKHDASERLSSDSRFSYY